LKKLTVILLMMCLLAACGSGQTLETVQDVYTPQTETPMEVHLTLPADALAQTLSSEAGRLYICNGFTVTVQTLPGGDLARTLTDTTGYDKSRLSLIETEKDGITCYRLSWVCLGEGGDQAARTLVLDDGVFHYAVTVMAPAQDAGALSDTWQEILSSVTLGTAP